MARFVLLTAKVARGHLESIKRVYAGDPKLQNLVFEHLRRSQAQIWTSASATLTFNGIMMAALMVIATAKSLQQSTICTIVPYYLSLGSFLFSALLCLVCVHQHNDYRGITNEEQAESVFLAGQQMDANMSFASLLLALVGTMGFGYFTLAAGIANG